MILRADLSDTTIDDAPYAYQSDGKHESVHRMKHISHVIITPKLALPLTITMIKTYNSTAAPRIEVRQYAAAPRSQFALRVNILLHRRRSVRHEVPHCAAASVKR
mmetsp:Transcript_40014/g.99141  ORF Transcript_40014/g.99141 Transcript_40014/m.99141 type:complete len:105 (-) Transcript_40014:1361-1675(-)